MKNPKVAAGNLGAALGLFLFSPETQLKHQLHGELQSRGSCAL